MGQGQEQPLGHFLPGDLQDSPRTGCLLLVNTSHPTKATAVQPLEFQARAWSPHSALKLPEWPGANDTFSASLASQAGAPGCLQVGQWPPHPNLDQTCQESSPWPIGQAGSLSSFPAHFQRSPQAQVGCSSLPAWGGGEGPLSFQGLTSCLPLLSSGFFMDEREERRIRPAALGSHCG